MVKAKILFAEDDMNLSVVVRDYLKIEGYGVELCSDGIQCWDAFNSNDYDLCILDVMMPNLDGFSLAEKIRQTDKNIPILFLTAKTDPEDRIKGFRAGADDYIVKPFNITELVLRIEVFLRRKSTKTELVELFKIGHYILDFPNLQLYTDNYNQKLTLREAELLRLLIQNQSMIIKRDDILIRIWGNDDYFSGRSLDVFISKLRKYLSYDPSIKIVNYHSVGFKLESGKNG
jgi:DNA-binding response OmpR family regulator